MTNDPHIRVEKLIKTSHSQQSHLNKYMKNDILLSP